MKKIVKNADKIKIKLSVEYNGEIITGEADYAKIYQMFNDFNLHALEEMLVVSIEELRKVIADKHLEYEPVEY